MFNRNDPISMTIKDPDNPEEVDAINSFIGAGEDFFIIKENSIYRMLTAETLDPENKHPETKHSYEKTFEIGSTSPVVARIIIQFEEIFKFLGFEELKKKHMLTYLWNANVYLINAYIVEKVILNEATELLPKCNAIIDKNRHKSTMPAFPQIGDLENRVRGFLNNAKLFLIETFRLLNFFYKMPFGNRTVAHFNSHLSWVQSNLGEDHRVTKIVSQDLEWIRLISECRNAMEHPEEEQKVTINNFALSAGNKFTGPVWKYDLRKKLNIKSESSDLINHLGVFSHNMLHFFEELLLICVEEKLESHKLLALARIPEEKVNPKCPVLYTVTLKKGFTTEKI